LNELLRPPIGLHILARMETKERVAELRAQGLTPKQIARSLGLRPAEVAELVRVNASAQVAPVEPRVVECLVNRGWSAGLGLDAATAWRELEDEESGSEGLVNVLITREHRYGKLATCGYLVDVFCLGVKNTIGPRIMEPHEYREFAGAYFAAHQGGSSPVPFELAQALVLGALDHARMLGFTPHEDFERARPHLGEPAAPSPIVFGDRGRPHYISGPNDDAARVINTLRRVVGDGKFDTTVLG
jgi:hypothetical protein